MSRRPSTTASSSALRLSSGGGPSNPPHAEALAAARASKHALRWGAASAGLRPSRPASRAPQDEGSGEWPDERRTTRMKLYRILTGPDDASFCHRVSEALSQGWELHGDPAPALTWDPEQKRVVCGQAI